MITSSANPIKTSCKTQKVRRLRFSTLFFAVAFLAFSLATISAAAQNQARAQSRVKTDTLFSKILNAKRAYSIYLPKSYNVNQEKSYPVLYLLHGLNGVNHSWFRDMRVQDVQDQLYESGASCEMIIVSPNAGGDISKGLWNGYFNMPGWAYEDFFYKEFLPYIESHYRIIGDKKHRAIAGLSMGGGGTTVYAQRYPHMYSAAYAMSALMTIPEVERSANASSSANTSASPQIDPSDKRAMLNQSVMEHDCVNFVARADEAQKAALRTVKWFVDCGDDDFLLNANIAFYQAMQAARIPCQFRVRDGGHTSEYWHTALYTCLPFVSMSFVEQ